MLSKITKNLTDPYFPKKLSPPMNELAAWDQSDPSDLSDTPTLTDQTREQASCSELGIFSTNLPS